MKKKLNYKDLINLEEKHGCSIGRTNYIPVCPDCKGTGTIKGSGNRLIYIKNHKCHKCDGKGVL